MSILRHIDSAERDAGARYLETAEFLSHYGAETNKNLEENWRRIVFSICIKNTYYHLRNHGFLLVTNGWRLSPAYDLNTNEYGVGLSLNIRKTDNSLAVDLALSVVRYFRKAPKRANDIIGQIQKSIKKWREIAGKNGISKANQDRMAVAFEL